MSFPSGDRVGSPVGWGLAGILPSVSTLGARFLNQSKRSLPFCCHCLLSVTFIEEQEGVIADTLQHAHGGRSPSVTFFLEGLRLCGLCSLARTFGLPHLFSQTPARVRERAPLASQHSDMSLRRGPSARRVALATVGTLQRQLPLSPVSHGKP